MFQNKEELKKIEKSQKKQKNVIITLIALVIILAGANLWMAFNYTPEKNNLSIPLNNLKINKYDLLNPAHDFFDNKDLIVNIQPLRSELTAIGEKNKNISLYFEVLNTGANISINKEAEFFPASLLKVPVAMTVAKKIEKGDWKWTNELVLMSSDKDYQFGDLYKNSIGTRFTIEKLTEEVLVNSDNTANNILMRNLDPEELYDIYKYLGLEDFFTSDGNISAKNYAVILRSLYNASYLSEENSQKLLSVLARSPFKEYLESGLPNGVVFSHKIGVSDKKEVYMDAGIVYAFGRPYILIFMAKIQDIKEAENIMKEVSGKIYDYIKNYNPEE